MGRHPGDVVRVFVGTLTVAVTTLVAARSRPDRVEAALFELANGLHPALGPPLSILMQAGSLAAVPVSAALALSVRRRRLAADVLIGGTTAWVLGKGVKAFVGRDRPDGLIEDVLIRGDVQTGLGFPSGHAAIAAALATVAGPYLGRSTRRAAWGLVGTVALGRMFVGAHLPVDVVGGTALGWTIGAGVHLLRGAPSRRPTPSQVLTALATFGLHTVEARTVAADARGSTPFIAATADGRRVFVKVVGRAQRDADLLFKLYRFLVFRDVQDEAPFATPKQQVEHEAYVALVAERSGANVPAVHLAGTAPDRSGVLVTDCIEGRRLDELSASEMDEALLERIWEQVAVLHANRIAHRDLRPGNILVDDSGRPWLVDFGFAAAAASPQQLAGDVAELLAATAVRVGAARAVRPAHDALGEEPLRQALHLLQPLALSSVTRAEIRSHPSVLERVRAEIVARTGDALPTVSPMTRLHVSRRTLVVLGVAALAVHVLLPQVGVLNQTFDAFANVRWMWLAAVAAASAAGYGSAAVVLAGAARRQLPLGRTAATQFAASFPARLVPAGVGRTEINQRYLERTGMPRAEAAAAVSLVSAAGLAVHLIATVLTVPFALAGGLPTIRPPQGWPLLLIVAAVAGAAGLFLRTPAARGVLRAALAATQRLALVLRSPGRTLRVLGGAAGVTIAQIVALSASLAAFGGHPSMVEIAAVYLLASAAGAASRIPGGVGVTEAMLVAGLVIFGVPAPPAVAAVLTFRLVSFWLPIGPAALAYRLLHRRSVV